MAYNPADLHIPAWLLRLLDILIRLRLPIGRHWRIAMTRPGILLLGALIGIWGAAFYSGNNLLYLCGGMLTAIVITSIWQAVVLLQHIPLLAHALPLWLETNTPFVLRQTISLKQPQTIAAHIDIYWQEASNIVMQLRSIQTDSVQPHLFNMQLDTTLLFQQRIALTLRHQWLQTAAPLGLWQISRKRSDDARLYIMPSPVTWQGSHLGSLQGQQYIEGDEFHHLRDYVPGDSLSHIHWRKANMDTKQWRVKQFQQPAALESCHHLCVDLRMSAHDTAADFERLLGMAWEWLKPYIQDNQPCELILGQQYIDCNNAKQQQQAIAAIATATPEQSPPIRNEGVLLSLLEHST